MDTVAPSPSGLSVDPFSNAGMVAWVDEQLETLGRLQAMAERVMVLLTERMKLGGARLASMAEGIAQLARAVRLSIALAVRLRECQLAWRRGERDPAAAQSPPPAPPRAAAATAAPTGVPAAVAGSAMIAVQALLKKRMASLYDRMGPEEFGDELRGKSNFQAYRIICRLLGVTPDPVLFAEPATVRAAPVAPAAKAAAAAPAAARERPDARPGPEVGPEAGPAAERAGGWRTGRGPP